VDIVDPFQCKPNKIGKNNPSAHMSINLLSGKMQNIIVFSRKTHLLMTQSDKPEFSSASETD